MFTERVLALCKAQKISKNKLLMNVNVNKSAFVNWGNRGNIPSGEIVAKIADYFDVSTDYLLGRTDNPRPIEETASLPHMPQHIAELTPGEIQVALAYRAADERARQMVDLALEPWKKSSKLDEAM